MGPAVQECEGESRLVEDCERERRGTVLCSEGNSTRGNSTSMLVRSWLVNCYTRGLRG
jgi:hypothetical protein